MGPRRWQQRAEAGIFLAELGDLSLLAFDHVEHVTDQIHRALRSSGVQASGVSQARELRARHAREHDGGQRCKGAAPAPPL
jgi:hypothetical protein